MVKHQTVPPLHISLPKKNFLSKEEENISNEDDDYSQELSHNEDLLDEEGYDQQNEEVDHMGKVLKENVQTISLTKESESEDDQEDVMNDTLSDSDSVDGAGTSKDVGTVPAQSSLYLMEKSKKKMAVKGGKLVLERQKQQRKDKGVIQLKLNSLSLQLT